MRDQRATILPYLLPGPEVLMQLQHFVEEANLRYKHEYQRHQNPAIVPHQLIVRELLRDIHDLKAQGEVWGIRKQLGLFHIYLRSAKECSIGTNTHHYFLRGTGRTSEDSWC